MTILAFIFWVVIALFASGIVTHRKDTQPKNKVHFYVARDKDGSLWLYMGKPVRVTQAQEFVSWNHGEVLLSTKYFSKYGLNENDYKDLKWEDEPLEVFVNMED